MAHAPSPPRVSSVAREPSTAHMSSATHAPAPLRVPAASIATADLQAELNYRCAGKDSRITIEGQRERHRNIEGRNLEGEFNSLASAQEVHAMHSTHPPSSPRLSAGYMRSLHQPEKYDGIVNPTEFLQIYSTSILATGRDEAVMTSYFPMALTRTTRSWLMNLPNGMLTSWQESCHQFTTNFESAYSRPGNETNLHTI
jgi:hypothetical protein